MTPAADFTQDSIEMSVEMLTSDEEPFKGAALHVKHRPFAAARLSCVKRSARAGRGVVEHSGIEPLTSWVRSRRSPS